MSTGIRATVEFRETDTCPLTELSAAAETTIDAVATNVCPDGAESVTEFGLDADHDPDERFTPVFSHGRVQRYRFTHGKSVDCPCECLGTHGCPVTRYAASDGTLELVFHAADYDELQAVVAALREAFPSVDIKRFVRSPDEPTPGDGVFVDRGKLTERQLEVLETAYEMGYFERPREATGSEVAQALDIDPSTFSEHLAAAESKLLADLL